MNILKPQNLNIKELEDNQLIDISEEEKINYAKFQNEECNDIDLYGAEFEHCKFTNISMQRGILRNITFKDVIFEQCNFSNTKFVDTSFIRCEFNNCKVSGCDFAENRLYNVAFIETNASYINLSMASIENILFKDTVLKSSDFQENKLKNIYFNNADLSCARFFKTSLKGIDLSNSKIEGIAISIEDIRGAIIDELQAVDLLYLVGVNLK